MCDSYRGHTASLQANAAKLSPKVGQIAQKYYKRMVSLMGQVPPELLLLFKTNDCLRHLDNNLGNPINTATGALRLTVFILCRRISVLCTASVFYCKSDIVVIFLLCGAFDG